MKEVETRAKWSAAKRRTFAVRLTRRGERYEASFTVEEAGARGEPRVIEGATCEEAMRAIAVSVALAVEAEPPDPPPPAPPPSSPPPPPAPPPSSPPSSPPRESSASPFAFAWSVGLDVEALGLAATGAVGAGAFEVGISPHPILDVRLSVRRSLEPTIDVGPTHSSLVWTSGRLEPCVLDLRVGRLGVGPCAFVELGQLLARGDTSRGTFWGAAGLLARADLRVAGPFELRATAGGFVPLDRTQIAYDPAFPVYRAPAVGLLGSLGIAARFR